MKIMNDFLIFHIITRTVVIYAVYLSIMKSMAPGRPLMNVVSLLLHTSLQNKTYSQGFGSFKVAFFLKSERIMI